VTEGAGAGAQVALAPDHGVALANLAMYRQNVCDWAGLPAQLERLRSLLRAAPTTRADPSEEPAPTLSAYQAVTFPLSQAETNAALALVAESPPRPGPRVPAPASSHAPRGTAPEPRPRSDFVRRARALRPQLPFVPAPPVARGRGAVDDSRGRLRLAYLSSDFGDHTTGSSPAPPPRPRPAAR